MRNYRVKLGLILVTAIFLWLHVPSGWNGFFERPLTKVCLGQDRSEAPEKKEADIKWFREEMKISPKYTEKSEGVLGMSWTHFFTMLFLMLFAVISIAALIMRQRRTKQLLDVLLTEEGKDGADS